MTHVYLVSIVLLSTPALAQDWPGLPPDCWQETRNIHGNKKSDTWQKNTTITRIQASKPKPGVWSPNNAYFYIAEDNARPTEKITIYAEKNYLTELTFSNLVGLSTIKWINEKLLFLRPWWGRIAGTDIIFDVEKEKIIYAETVRDGSLAYQQYRESCPQFGCVCIKKSEHP